MKSVDETQQTQTLLSNTDVIITSNEWKHSSSLSGKLMFAVTATILTTFCNGLAYYGISGNLNLFLQTELNQSKADASINTTLFTGTRFFITILGAVVADSFLGRFKTIILGLCIYLVGTIGVAIISIQVSSKSAENVTSTEEILFWFALYLVAFGAGGIGPNNGSLGAEQFDFHAKNSKQAILIKSEYKTMDGSNNNMYNEDGKSKLSKYKESFFQWRYFSNNTGTLIAYSVIAYLCQDISFGIGYSIPAIAILLGLVIFILPANIYYKFKPKGSILLKFIKILFYMLFNQKQKLSQYQPNEMRDVKNILSIFPFWICYIIYASVWSQLNTLIYAQGCQLNYRLSSLDMNFPIAGLTLFSIMPILTLIPLFDKCLFPLLRNKYNFKVTMLQKIGCGFIFASLSMMAAGIVEIIRRDYSDINTNYLSICDDNESADVYISNLSIFWQIPVFVLEGISEVLAAVTAYEFFFNEAPESMKSVMSAAFTMSTGLGSWITGIYIVFANIHKGNEWITQDLNDGHLDWYFFSIALFMICAWIFFVYHAKKYKYNNYNYSQQNNNESTSELSILSCTKQQQSIGNSIDYTADSVGY